MIDFHNHILPGVDDGAKTMEESICMLRDAQDQGITDVVNTVHFQHPKMEGKNTDFDYISSVRDELEEEMFKEGININIHLGSEVFFNFNLLEILDNPLVTFCNGKYMLIEFQTHQFPKDFDRHLYDLAISGITPIIAHPERYKPVQNDVNIIEKLINSGCLIQIDAGSILGHFGPNCKAASEIMLKRKMTHIIGSDSHALGKRNFCLKESISKAQKIVNYDLTPLVHKNPHSIIKGEVVQIPEIVPLEESGLLSRLIRKIIKE